MNARASILARLRSAPKSAAPPAPDVCAYYAKYSPRQDESAHLLRCKAALEAAHAQVLLTGTDSWPDLLLELARTKGLRTVLVGAGRFPAQPLASRTQTDVALVTYDQITGARARDLFESIDASVTLARGAIAQTGSLILWPDAAEPRLMSLVPPVHFVLLESSKIHADLHSAMQVERWSAGLPSNALLISGPSKTADIQQTLAYGAHGPRELIVLVVPSFGTAP